MKLSQGAILIVDKPVGLNCRAASAKALDKFKTYFPKEYADLETKTPPPQQKRGRHSSSSKHIKMGHAGTLDPMATGCLPVLLGQATKLQDHLPIHNKRYLAHLRLGVQTKTDDADGEVLQTDSTFAGITPARLEELQSNIRDKFPLGKTKQTPPIFSAIHIEGKRAYDLARLGQVPVMPEREIELLAFSVSYVDEQTVEMDVSCGTGTYIRTLGVDLAKNVFNTLGHLVKLRRVSSGPYSLALERKPSSAEQQQGDEVLISHLIEFRDAVASFAKLVRVDSREMLDWIKTGKNKLLYASVMQALEKEEGQRPEKIAFENDWGVIALFKMEYEVENMVSICHFKLEEDLIPFVSKEQRFEV